MIKSFAASSAVFSNTRPRVVRIITVLFSLGLIIIVADQLIPIFISSYVNRVLNSSPDYRGKVKSISVNLWRGAYTLHHLDIVKSSGKIPVPLFSSPLIDLSIQWREILRGSLVGEVEMKSPTYNLVNGDTKAEIQTGEEHDWRKVVRELFPVKINRLSVENGQIHYRDFSSNPKLDIYLKDIHAEATNLTNSLRLSRSLVSSIEATATLQKSGRIYMKAGLNPYTHPTSFSLALSMERLELVDLNNFFRAYANFDVKHGAIGIYSEIEVLNGSLSGYVKPIAKDVEIIDLEQDAKNPLNLLWQSAVALVVDIFTNPPHQQVASKIPLEGKIDNPDMGALSAIGSLLRNAFIKAIKPGIETASELPKRSPSHDSE